MNIRGKKGQDLTIGTLILIALGVVVLVLLIVGFTRGWDFVFGKFELAPGQDLEAVAQACKFSKEAGLRIDYCDFKKISYQGRTEYVNCQDTRLASAIAEAQGDDIECSEGAVQAYCMRQYTVTRNEVSFPASINTGFCPEDTDQKAIINGDNYCCVPN